MRFLFRLVKRLVLLALVLVLGLLSPVAYVELMCRPDGSLGFMVETTGGVLRLEAASSRSFLVYGQEGSGESDLICGAQGRAVVVRYRPSGTPTIQGEIVWLSFPGREPAASRTLKPRAEGGSRTSSPGRGATRP